MRERKELRMLIQHKWIVGRKGFEAG
jgi:hypothetical protein